MAISLTSNPLWEGLAFDFISKKERMDGAGCIPNNILRSDAYGKPEVSCFHQNLLQLRPVSNLAWSRPSTPPLPPLLFQVSPDSLQPRKSIQQQQWKGLSSSNHLIPTASQHKLPLHSIKFTLIEMLGNLTTSIMRHNSNRG